MSGVEEVLERAGVRCGADSCEASDRDCPGCGMLRAHVAEQLQPLIRQAQAEAWDEGYAKGNLDGYFGTSDEWETNPHGTDHRLAGDAPG